MNRIDQLFQTKHRDILSVFYTAGFPQLDATIRIATLLEQGGADMLEIGIPYSDPLADGPVIQRSSGIAIENGMSLDVLFSQLKHFRKHCSLPALLMGYLNPVLQFGFEKFCKKCGACGIDGLILPDLPFDDYKIYQPLFEENNLRVVFLITPQTPPARVRAIDALSTAFIYMVSSTSTTGSSAGFSKAHTDYFRRIEKMKLHHPVLTGFGIHDKATFTAACENANGAIVGSHFLKLLMNNPPQEAVRIFFHSLKNQGR